MRIAGGLGLPAARAPAACLIARCPPAGPRVHGPRARAPGEASASLTVPRCDANVRRETVRPRRLFRRLFREPFRGTFRLKPTLIDRRRRLVRPLKRTGSWTGIAVRGTS